MQHPRCVAIRTWLLGRRCWHRASRLFSKKNKNTGKLSTSTSAYIWAWTYTRKWIYVGQRALSIVADYHAHPNLCIGLCVGKVVSEHFISTSCRFKCTATGKLQICMHFETTHLVVTRHCVVFLPCHLAGISEVAHICLACPIPGCLVRVG